MLDPGDKLPDFKLPDQTGQERTLTELAGSKGLVLYVYPKDNTAGCAAEAEEFRDLKGDFERMGFRVVGLSKDSIKSHVRFADKYRLTFPLLSDPETGLIQALGAWGEKKMAGRVFEGVFRSTWVADKTGRIIQAYPRVKRAKGHAINVLADLKEM